MPGLLCYRVGLRGLFEVHDEICREESSSARGKCLARGFIAACRAFESPGARSDLAESLEREDAAIGAVVTSGSGDQGKHRAVVVGENDGLEQWTSRQALTFSRDQLGVECSGVTLTQTKKESALPFVFPLWEDRYRERY